MNWFVGFNLTSSEHLSASKLSCSEALKNTFAAVMQVDSHSVRIVISASGHAECAIGKGTAALWELLETEGVVATVRSARLGSEFDCTDRVRYLERLRGATGHWDPIGELIP